MNKIFSYLLVLVTMGILVLSVGAFVSAFSFGDMFTGQATKNLNSEKLAPANWEESDLGKNPEEGGAVFTGNKIYFDYCINSRNLYEYFIKDNKVRKKAIRCDFGCDSEEFTFHSQTALTGACKAAPEGSCEEFGDSGIDPFTPGIVSILDTNNIATYKEDAVVGDNENGNSNLLREYSCDENNQLVKETYKCNGLIRSSDIEVSPGFTRKAYYCEIQPITCDKEGKTISFTRANGNTNDKTDKCFPGTAGSDDVNDKIAPGSIVQYYCVVDQYDVDGDGDVDLDDVNSPNVDPWAAPGERQRIMEFIESGSPFEKVVSSCGLTSCSETETEVMCNDPTCTETDKRIDKNKVGTTTIAGSNLEGTDTCIGESRVLEYWCSDEVATQLKAKWFDCAEGKTCVDGACI